jgi:hypothetical protein
MPELIEARPPVALVAGVAGRGAEDRKGSTGVPVPGSPRLKRWQCVGGGGESSGVGRSGLINGQGGGSGGRRGCWAPFYRVGGGTRRPSVRGERVAAVVRHNGGGGNRFGRGSVGVVVGSDEGGAPAVMGAEGAPGGGACTHAKRWRLRPSV